jgi:Putative beta-barrel porin-2, OmpL-like. bbp2
MKRLSILFLITTCSSLVWSQVINTATMDTTDFRYNGKVTVEGYLDSYYAYDFNKPSSGDRAYFVSMARHNEITINLAYIGVKYSSSRLRGHFVPGFGTYINANYANEPFSLKNIVEASAGVKLSHTKNIWMDVGIFGSPYTNESAISKDHLAYTRSFAPEYVPYYLSGVKLSIPISPKVNGYFYLLNGWQQIQDANQNKSLGTQLEYRPSNTWLINWNTYVGNEQSPSHMEFGTRYFTDVFFIYSKGKWSATGCYYLGLQKRNNMEDAYWWQANIIGRYNLTEKLSVTGRLEYFDDPDLVQITPITSASNFSSYSSSLGLNLKVAENILFRAEGRTFLSGTGVYERDGTPVKNSNLIITNVTLWF